MGPVRLLRGKKRLLLIMRPEFNPCYPRGGRREPTSVIVLWPPHMLNTHMHACFIVAKTTIKMWITPNLHNCLLGWLTACAQAQRKAGILTKDAVKYHGKNALQSAWDSMLSDFKLITVVCWETFRYCRVLNSLTFRGTPHLLKSQALGMTYESPGSASGVCLSAHVLPLANSVALGSHIPCAAVFWVDCSQETPARRKWE